MSMVGVEIKFKNGKTDWIDPVDENEFNSMKNNATDKYIINSGCYSYEYEIKDIADIFTYEIHDCCGFDKRTGHSSKCKNLGND